MSGVTVIRHRAPPQRSRSPLHAELDGFYTQLYGLTRDELAYILDIFASASLSTGPIVRRKDEERFGGYRSSRLTLEHYEVPRNRFGWGSLG